VDAAVARQMNPFETYILDRVTHAMTSLEFKPVHPEAVQGGEPQSAADIYALSFYLWGEEDDPRRSILEVSYNTVARYKSCVPGPDKKSGRPVASSDAEAKWNYAFWLQKPILVIGTGDDPKDEIGIKLRQEWIAKQGLSYTDEEEEEDFDRTLELDQQIERRFWQTCTRVARRLHDDGLITSTFGRAIPIIVHDLDFDDDSFDHTRNANPDGVAADFLKGF